LNAERRSRTRFCPVGLSAHLIIEPTLTENNIVLEGSVLDISYSGIKLKLHQRLQATFEEAHIRIVIRLPESGVPLTIHGMIRHIHEAETSHCGLQYADHHEENELDELMFECIKLAPILPDEAALSIN
jgi:hypothetical protein